MPDLTVLGKSDTKARWSQGLWTLQPRGGSRYMTTKYQGQCLPGGVHCAMNCFKKGQIGPEGLPRKWHSHRKGLVTREEVKSLPGKVNSMCKGPVE